MNDVMNLLLPLIVAIFGSTGFWTYLSTPKGTKQVMNAIKKLQDEVDHIKEDIDMREAKNNRDKIVRFADKLRMGEKASIDHYDHIMRTVDDYEDYCRDHPDFTNGIAVISAEKIKEHYRNGDFL